VPFEVPEGWVWTTVSEISNSILYGVSESAKVKGEYKLLRITDIQDNKVDWESVPFTDFDSSKVSSYLLQNNDILFARTGATVGKSYLVQNLTDKAIYASYLIRVQMPKMVLPNYVKYFFESGYYWGQINLKSVGVGQPNVNGTILGDLSIPIPGYKEQHRIVIEIEKWFALIDVIESSKEDLQSTIKQAKSKILDLAIHGKLVPQDPNDEPAMELLRRINPKAEITCDNAHYPFEVPKKWIICKLGEVVSIINGKSQKDVENKKGEYPIYGSGGIIGRANQYLCLAGSTIIGRKGTINNPIFVSENFWNVDTAFGMKPQKMVDDTYFYYFCLSFNFSKLDKSTAVPSLTKTTIGNLALPIPPLPEQHRIVAKIEELFAVLDNIQNSLEA